MRGVFVTTDPAQPNEWHGLMSGQCGLKAGHRLRAG